MWSARRRGGRRARVLGWLVVAVLVALLLGVLADRRSSSGSGRPTTLGVVAPSSSMSGAAVPDTVAASPVVDRLEVAPEGGMEGYDRSHFRHWTDADGDGCDTRAEVLIAESTTPAQVDPFGCSVVAGDWVSVYDGYTTDHPTELEVDHVVSLAEAWRSGASSWSPDRRAAFANDLDHPGALIAVTAATNQSKSDRDPASWQPPNRRAWCDYAAAWVSTKVKWSLTADPDEVEALVNLTAGCPPARP